MLNIDNDSRRQRGNVMKSDDHQSLDDRVNDDSGRQQLCGDGFTLVELLVVISIIAVLAALLIPAAFAGIRTAKEARIILEVTNISQALAQYKTAYGEYPPDFSMDGSDSNTDIVRRRKQLAINKHMARSFRRRNTPALPNSPTAFLPNPISPDVDYLTGEQLDALNPTTALAFWLQGFSNDPQHPLTGPDKTPMFDFDKSRLTTDPVGPFAAIAADANVDNDVILARYFPAGDTARTPYIYYRADVSTPAAWAQGDNSGKFANQVLGVLSTSMVKDEAETLAAYVDAARWATTAGAGAAQPYFRYSPATYPPGGNTNNAIENPANSISGMPDKLWPYAAPKKFQLISAGLDGQYGAGGNPANGLGNMLGTLFPKIEKDNIVSMTEGTLRQLDNE